MNIDTIDFLDPATQENPFASYEALLTQAPVHFMPSIQAYVVSSHAAIRHVVTHPAIWSIDFRARPDAQLIKTPRARALLEAGGFPRDTKLTTDPPAHTAYRAAVAKAFMPARVAAQKEFIASVVNELVQGLRGGTQCEFMRDVAWTLPMRVVTRLLGVPAEDADRIKHWSDVWVEPLAYGLSEERELYVAQEEIALQKYLVAHMQSKLDNPGEDILTELANARMADGSPMPLAEKVGLAEHLIVGGHETATSALGSGMMILAQRPDIAAALRADPSRVERFVEEVLRLESPSAGFFRVAVQDAELEGVHIPAGSMVHLRFAAANRDASVFERPAELDLDRPNPRAHLAFSYGVHTCLGAPYARLELQEAFRALVLALDEIALDPSEPPPAHIPGLSLRTLKALHITYSARSAPEPRTTTMQISTPRATLTTEAILALLNAAVARAQALDVRIHVAICDSAARRVGFLSMDGALPIAAITGERKAFTAANMNMSTGQWEAYVNSLKPGEQKIVDAIEGYVAARGGFPVRQGGTLLGSIGISGASQEIDADIGLAALAAIGAEVVEG